VNDLPDWIRLTKTGASARRLNQLLDHFGTPGAVFEASAGELSAAVGCRRNLAEKLLDPLHAATERDFKLMERLDVDLVPRTDPRFPALLREISDPPPALYVRGTLSPEDRKAVAIVGSRRATEYGLRVAGQFAAALTRAGVTVVSGMARGLDTAVHWGALKSGGRTLACLGCGVDVAYPPENRELSVKIPESGALLSEYPMMAPPDAWHFPSRNRIISGLSLGVVVIEAPTGSGALITADCAVDQNREVFAVPGSIENYRNKGPHALLRDGAKLVESVEDILSELRLDSAQPELPLDLLEPAPVQLSADETALAALLRETPQPMDDLILEAGLTAARVSAALLTLELKGLARRVPGNAYRRAG
jgi:DNA processing protein